MLLNCRIFFFKHSPIQTVIRFESDLANLVWRVPIKASLKLRPPQRGQNNYEVAFEIFHTFTRKSQYFYLICLSAMWWPSRLNGGWNSGAAKIRYLLSFRKISTFGILTKLTNSESPPFLYVSNVGDQDHSYVNEWKGM